MSKKQKKILLRDQEVSYTLKSYRLSRRLRLLIYGNGEISVTKPVFVNEKTVEDFLISKADWILNKLATQKKTLIASGVKDSLESYLKNKKQAAALVKERLEYFNQFYGFRYGAISIRRQRTRWGSCSKKGNLSFNYRLVFLAPEEADYIIVHELCHLGEFNHSPKFWALVAKTVPNYLALRRKLKMA
ncbi:MAG: M48 family metallopeptidase [Patescibacteria group bacterium]